MGKGIWFTYEFKQDTVAQIVRCGYPTSEVAERLGISTKSLYTRKSQFSKLAHVGTEVFDQAAYFKRLKRDLARSTQERTTLKKRPRTLPESLSEIRGY